MTQQETNAVEEFANTYNKQKWDRLQYGYVDAVIAGAQFLDELRKPSERIVPYLEIEQEQAYARMEALGIMTEAQTFEQCVNELLWRLENSKPSENCENQEESRKIAELLQAAKDALSTFFSIGCTEEAEIVQALIKAISNYPFVIQEKQSK